MTHKALNEAQIKALQVFIANLATELQVPEAQAAQMVRDLLTVSIGGN
jgi:hypothetical protein